jgi:hypothetical protein
MWNISEQLEIGTVKDEPISYNSIHLLENDDVIGDIDGIIQNYTRVTPEDRALITLSCSSVFCSKPVEQFTAYDVIIKQAIVLQQRWNGNCFIPTEPVEYKVLHHHKNLFLNVFSINTILSMEGFYIYRNLSFTNDLGGRGL